MELHEFEVKNQSNPEMHISGNYMLGFVEFDDQGWYHNPEQEKALFRAIQNYRSDHTDADFLIVTFAHGWKHNAKPDDENVKEFRKLLERLTLLERANAKSKPRLVVGVYLGWRGASLNVPFIEDITFWTRKNAAERVGDRSAKQLFMQLNGLRSYLNGSNNIDEIALDRSKTQLIIIGHSFGGLLTYHALHTSLMERAIKIEINEDTKEYRYDMAKSFGDFVLLVNPAFEGASYEPLLMAAQARCYSKTQRPAMAIVTSKGDAATKYAFPIGRFYTFTQSAPHIEEREAVMNTVGHSSRYITHDLKFDGDSDSTKRTDGLSPTSSPQLEKAVKNATSEQQETLKSGNIKTKYDGAIVVRKENVPANFPYLVMSADTEIIKNHNDIWNDRFANFIISFINEEIMKNQENNDAKDHIRDCVPFGLGVMTKRN